MSKSSRNIFLIVISITVIFFLLFRQHSPFGSRNSSFNVPEGREITRIELSDKDKKLVLEKKGENWIVNGRYETRKSSIAFITRILKEIKIKSPVSPEKFNAEIVQKGIQPVKVKVYGNSRLLKSFLVYKTASNPHGNIMKIRERSKPFIVYVPGFDDDIGSAFIINELFWQPFTVFNLLPSEISSVSLENIADTSSSFMIQNTKNHISLNSGNSELTGWDSALVRRFLTYFTYIPFEKWAFDLSVKEQEMIESGPPAYRITVETSNNKKTVLTLWERSVSTDGNLSRDTDRLWGKTNAIDKIFLMRYFDVDPILKKRSYFFPRKF